MLINDLNSLNLTPFTSHQHISGGFFLWAMFPFSFFFLSPSLSRKHIFIPPVRWPKSWTVQHLRSNIFSSYSLFYRMRFIRYGSHQNGWTKQMIYKHIASVEVSVQLCWVFFCSSCVRRVSIYCDGPVSSFIRHEL